MNCKQCNKEFNREDKDRPNEYCSLPCWRQYESIRANKGTCKQCSKEGIPTKRKYCSHSCYSESLKSGLTGKNNPHYKERVKKICPVCNKDFYLLPSRAHKYTHCSKECSYKREKSEEERENKRRIMLERNWTGENSPGWKGGKTKLTSRLRECAKYKEWRRLVYERDSYTCRECEAKGYIEAHHIKPFSKVLDSNNIKDFESAMECVELWDEANGLTLCKPCHKKTDSYGKKKLSLI